MSLGFVLLYFLQQCCIIISYLLLADDEEKREGDARGEKEEIGGEGGEREEG